jgi:hypothetical protein
MEEPQLVGFAHARLVPTSHWAEALENAGQQRVPAGFLAPSAPSPPVKPAVCPHQRRCIEDLNAIGESLVELPEPKPKKKKKL